MPDPTMPGFKDAVLALTRAALDDDLRWYAQFDLELGRITDVHDDREMAQYAVDRFNEEDRRGGGAGNFEVRAYTLPELVVALCQATMERQRLADTFAARRRSARRR